MPQPSEDEDAEDDVDAALTDLQISLEGGNGSTNGITDIVTVPSLQEDLKYLRYSVECRIP